MTDPANIDRATSGPRLWVEFNGLGVFVFDPKKSELEILLIDAQRAGIVPHQPVLMVPLGRVQSIPMFDQPRVVTVGDMQIAIWDLAGRDLTCSAPAKPRAGVTLPTANPTPDPSPKPAGSADAWNNLQWLPDMHAVCGATAIRRPELVTAKAVFTHGSMFVGMPPVGVKIGVFRFEGVPDVPPRSYSDRGGCVCPMDATGVTLTLTNRATQSSSSIPLVPDGGADLHIAIANYAQSEAMPMPMATEHFTVYYELLDSKTQPVLVPVPPSEAPSITCIPPFLIVNPGM